MNPLRKWRTILLGGRVETRGGVDLGFEALPNGCVRMLLNTTTDLGYEQSFTVDLDPGERDELWELFSAARTAGHGTMSTSRAGRSFRVRRSDG
jgi:hypothetical protein